MRNDPTLTNVPVRIPHHILKGGVAFNFVQVIFHVRVDLDCLANDDAAIPAAAAGEFLK
jgi:hypothetical protein